MVPLTFFTQKNANPTTCLQCTIYLLPDVSSTFPCPRESPNTSRTPARWGCSSCRSCLGATCRPCASHTRHPSCIAGISFSSKRERERERQKTDACLPVYWVPASPYLSADPSVKRIYSRGCLRLLFLGFIVSLLSHVLRIRRQGVYRAIRA